MRFKRSISIHLCFIQAYFKTNVNFTFSGFEDDAYAVTPVMSTYLLAIIVADYGSINISQSNQLRYEVIAREAALNAGQGSYALTTGEQLVIQMNQHTGIDYFNMHPQIKMTHAAIPDFSAGAMENWGLITYRLNALVKFFQR